MKDYAPDSIRNVALAGHGGTGKTSLGEAMLFVGGATTRLGKVEDGSTVSDWDPDEHKRQFSLAVSVLPLEWKGHKINVIDTPGYMDFMGEVKCGLRAAETVLVTIDAVSGVQVGTEFAWRFADELQQPRAIFINRMDRENADFDRTVQQIQAAWGPKCVPVHLPIGNQASFKGVVDVLSQKAYIGDKGEETPIPDDMQGAADQAREKLIEAAAETDDALITKYLEGENLTAEELANGVKAGILAGSLVPIFTGSGTKVIGIHCLLDAIISMLPAPTDRPVELGDRQLKVDPNGPLTALVFKTAADPYVGRLTYFKVLSGTLKGDSHAWNASQGVDERIGAVYRVTGKGQEQVPSVVAGDIGAVAKLADTHTGQTLGTKEVTKLPEISFPSPAYSAAVSPKTKADLDKMGNALQRIVEEDPSLRLERNPATGEMILSGLGDSHVEVNLERIKRKFGVELEAHTPRIPYRETIRGNAEAEYTHKKQTGGHGQFARVQLKVEPLARGEGVKFENKTVGGVVPKQYIGSVEKGVIEGSHEGILAHFPMVDAKVSLTDGKEHPVDSSDIAFKIAASMALRKATEDAHPILLEPIVDMHITVPEANTGDVISDLNGKRAKVLGMNPAGSMTTIEAQAPLSEVQRYSADMRSITQGRGVFSMEFSHYEEVPAHLAQKIIDQATKDREAARRNAVVQMRDVVARESSAWAELARLMSDPLYWAPPRTGNGRAVLVLPGLFGNDLYLQPLRSWLSRSGYRPIRSDLWVNAGCPERLTRRTEAYLKRELKPDEPLAIIGHSRGGLLARTIATRMQERASHLILLGSPVGGVTRWAEASGYTGAPASSQVRQASDRARRFLDPDCDVPDCGCPFPTDFLRALHPNTQVVSIYSPDDPIVPWRACRVPGAHNVPVAGTHTGLAFNRAVYRELAQVLRE